MSTKILSNSLRKHLRRKKAEFRRQFLSHGEAEAKIKELVEKTFQAYSKKRALVAS